MARQTLITPTVALLVSFCIPASVPAQAPGPGAESRTTAAVSGTTPQTAAVHEIETVVAVHPWVSSRVPATVRAKLESSFALAARKIQEEPRCRDLFAAFEADGLEMLENTLYYPAELKLERRLCPRAYAYTLVGGAPTWLCRGFSRLSDQRAAVVLLHEALHHAGVDESHQDREVMTPRAIDRMLSEACGF